MIVTKTTTPLFVPKGRHDCNKNNYPTLTPGGRSWL